MARPACYVCKDQPATHIYRAQFACAQCQSRSVLRFIQREVQKSAKRLVHPPLKRQPPVAVCLSGGVGSALLAACLESRAAQIWVRRAIHVREGEGDVADAWFVSVSAGCLCVWGGLFHTDPLTPFHSTNRANPPKARRGRESTRHYARRMSSLWWRGRRVSPCRRARRRAR